MRIYLDNCAFNRPFDDQGQLRIRLETEAKLFLQSKIKYGELDLIWSYILQFENQANPFAERRAAIERWRSLASAEIEQSTAILSYAHNLMNIGVKAKDALHVACAVEGRATFFVTTDDRLIKKLDNLNNIKVLNPVKIISLIDGYDN